MTNIFEYSNISDPNIYSDIRSYQNFDTNIFGYSFVPKIFIRIYSDIRSCHFLDTNIFGYSFVSKSIRMSHSGLVGEVNLGADHSLIKSSEGLRFCLLLLFIRVIGALAGSAPPLVLSS